MKRGQKYSQSMMQFYQNFGTATYMVFRPRKLLRDPEREDAVQAKRYRKNMKRIRDFDACQRGDYFRPSKLR